MWVLEVCWSVRHHKPPLLVLLSRWSNGDVYVLRRTLRQAHMHASRVKEELPESSSEHTTFA